MWCYWEMKLTPPQTNGQHKIGRDLLYSEGYWASTLILLAYQDVRTDSCLSKIWNLAVLLILLLRLDAIKCLYVTSSRCDVWCVTRDCVTGWWRDGGITPMRDTRDGESLVPVTQWLHAPCLSMISFIVLDVVSRNRKSSVSRHWVGLFGWELRACDQVLMPQMPSSFLPMAGIVVACLRVFAWR